MKIKSVIFEFHGHYNLARCLFKNSDKLQTVISSIAVYESPTSNDSFYFKLLPYFCATVKKLAQKADGN